MKTFISFTNKKGTLITINMKRIVNCHITRAEVCIRLTNDNVLYRIYRRDDPELFEALCVFFYFDLQASLRIHDGVNGEEFLGERYIYNEKNRAKLTLMRKK